MPAACAPRPLPPAPCIDDVGPALEKDPAFSPGRNEHSSRAMTLRGRFQLPA